MSVEDQAANLRRLMHQVRNTRTIAVTSGKGGVGKSNIAVNLAILLSAGGNRVALVDADLGMANLDVLLDVASKGNLSHVIAGAKSLEEIIIDLPCGVQLVPGANGLARVADLSEFERHRLMDDLTALEAQNDIIVVDTGAGIGPGVLQFAAAADHTVVVTTPEPTAITDGYSVIKLVSQKGYDGQLSLLVNLATDRREARATYLRIATTASRFLGRTVCDAGYVVYDPKVPEAVKLRQPFVLAFPNSHASRCLASLASRLCVGGALIQARKGFFRSVASWFV